MRMGERTKRVLALLTAGAMVFTNTGMDVLASTSIVVGGITSGEDKKDETPTESESESETGTEQESESESETGSEAESEAAYTDQKVFTCEGDQATVTVTVPDEAQMPAGTELEVQPVVENSVTYEEIKNALTNEAQEVLGISAFHLAFTTDGEAQIPSDIDYQVQIDYKDAVLAAAEGQEDSSVGAYVNQAGATADIQTSENGAVEAVSLSTKELGDVAVVRTGAVAEAKTVYTYEDANVIVTATIEKADAVPDDAKFVVTELNEEEHKADYEATEEELQKYAEEQQIGYTGYVIYDMHFEDAEGNEIEPEEGSVKVAVEYKSAKEISDIESQSADSNVAVLHLDESQNNVNVENVTQNVEVNDNGDVKGAEFEVANFSKIVLADITDSVKVTVNAPEGTYYVALMKDNRSVSNVEKVIVTKDQDSTITYLKPRQNEKQGDADVKVLSLKDGQNYRNDYDQNAYTICSDGDRMIQKNGAWDIRISDTVENEIVVANQVTVSISKFEMQPGKTETYHTILGNALYYGLVANEISLYGHQETNFATGILHNVKASDVQTSKNSNGGAGATFIGAMDGNNLLFNLNGNEGSAIIFAGENVRGKIRTNGGVDFDYTTYTEQEIKNLVQSMVDETTSKSESLNTGGYDFDDVSFYNSTQKYELNIAGLGASDSGTYYINFKPGQYATIKEAKLKICLKKGQTVVFNIPDSDVGFNQYCYEYFDDNGNSISSEKTTNTGAEYDEISRQIIFNCPNAVSAATKTATAGIFLVPKATFSCDETGAGWIVANIISKIGGKEWHHIYHDLPVYTSYALKAKKIVNGNTPASTENGLFTFKLYRINDDNTVELVDEKPNKENGRVEFDTFGKVESTGTYWYKITEEGNVAGYKLDETIYYAKVVVTAVLNQNVITSKNATVTYYKGAKDGEEVVIPVFNNTKTDISEEGSAEIQVIKKYNAAYPTGDDAFEFTLTGEKNAPMPEGSEGGSKSVKAESAEAVSFGSIHYTENGTYSYKVTEKKGSLAGVSYDGTEWDVNVDVADGSNGQKTVTVSYRKGADEKYKKLEGTVFTAEFKNSYSEEGNAEIKVVKSYNSEYPTGNDAFEFTLTGKDSAPMPEGSEGGSKSVKAESAEAVSFGSIHYTENGTYNYTVEENAGKLPNVIYDKTVYDVQIKVEDGGKADGVKKITVMSKKQADKEYAPLDGTVFTAAFSNTRYAVNVKKTDLTGVNEVKGATITVYKASDINEDGTVKENAEKVTEFVSDGGANDISEELIRGKVYVLVETSAPEGYAFTNNIPFTLNEDGTVTVDEELQAKDGTILVKDALIGEQKVPLAATKTLTGAALTGDDFSFTLEEVKEDGTTELLQTKTNDAAGKVAFDDLTYDYKAEGKTFTYVVKETDTQKTGITYSKEAYTVKVVISRADTEGKMTAEVAYTDAAGKAADAMNFTNTFAGSVSLVKVGPQQQKLAGAKFMLYQQQPSTDYKAYAETEYVTDANGNIKVDGLPEGNYYFVETTAPDGYVIKMNDDGTAKQYPFTIQAGKAEATVGVDIDLGLIENDTITPGEGGDIDLGSVTIEKSVLNAAGKTITADGTTFYAGVFTKNQDGTYTLVKSATLEQNGKVTIKDLTVGTYYLFETTKQGDRINEADFAFEITGNGQEFQIKSDENTDVKLVNKEKETVESEEETEKESEVETETKTKKTTTVKTGDTTPIALYVGLLAAAAVLIALIVFLRKRKNK